MKRLLFILLLTFTPLNYAQKQSITLLGTGNLIHSSVGAFNNDYGIQQTMRKSAGPAAGYEYWWGTNGITTLFTWTPTNSKLSALKGNPWPHGTNVVGQTLTIWPITRYEINLGYQHRFYPQRRLSPYTSVGGLGTILWGGGCANNCSGLDGQYGIFWGGGLYYKLPSNFSLKAGLQEELLKASNYGDGTFRSSLTTDFVPQLGVVFNF